jgi:hypothetical protein
MSLDFRDLAPGFAAWIGGLSKLPLIQYINETVWIFAIVETVHLLLLAVLGGSVLALNLRLLGVALRDVPEPVVERATRPWLLLGAGGTILTGIAMGITTVNTLLPSPAFFVKMVALVAAILFSVEVARRVRRTEAAQRAEYIPGGRTLAVLALLLWVASLTLFATTRGLGSGALLVALAGFSLFAAFAGRYRSSYLIGLALVLGGGLIVVDLLPSTLLDRAEWIGLLPIAGAFGLAAAVGLLTLRDYGWVPPSQTRLAAFASTLAWVTVAAAGRWIGFS